MSQKGEDAAGKATSGGERPAARRSRVTAAEVVDYLRQHPDFLQRHPEALDGQRFQEKSATEGVVDLQKFMLERLRRDVARLRTEQDDLLANSRDNLSTQARVHEAVLALLGAKGLTGDGYDGHTFWDTETFSLPVLSFLAPAAADAQWLSYYPYRGGWGGWRGGQGVRPRRRAWGPPSCYWSWPWLGVRCCSW